MSIIEIVKNLNLPVGQYVVFGGGPMVVRGIRSLGDLDILVTTELYNKLKNSGWEEKPWSDNGFYLYKDGIEVDDTWHYGKYDPTPEEIIQKAEIIEGIHFAPLEEVIKWKQAFGRPKDLEDIKLIQLYLRQSRKNF